MTLIDARCTVCGQEEGTFPSLREAMRVLMAYGWWFRLDGDGWLCPPCAQRGPERSLRRIFWEVSRSEPW